MTCFQAAEEGGCAGKRRRYGASGESQLTIFRQQVVNCHTVGADRHKFNATGGLREFHGALFQDGWSD